MEVDTGTFRALTARADAVDALSADVSRIRQHLEVLAMLRVVQELPDDRAILRAAQELADAAGPAPRASRGRHAARRPGYLRLVGGGGQ
jgi:hypothetical protein